jgi:hypothetical protein
VREINDRRDFQGPCPMPLATKGLVLFAGGGAGNYGAMIPVRNSNSPYMYQCIDTAQLHRMNLTEYNVVLKLRAKLPSTPDGLYKGTRVSSKEAYDGTYGHASCDTASPYSVGLIVVLLSPVSALPVVHDHERHVPLPYLRGGGWRCAAVLLYSQKSQLGRPD